MHTTPNGLRMRTVAPRPGCGSKRHNFSFKTFDGHSGRNCRNPSLISERVCDLFQQSSSKRFTYSWTWFSPQCYRIRCKAFVGRGPRFYLAYIGLDDAVRLELRRLYVAVKEGHRKQIRQAAVIRLFLGLDDSVHAVSAASGKVVGEFEKPLPQSRLSCRDRFCSAWRVRPCNEQPTACGSWSCTF
jgi:hypothetical protein